jgi:hypothetical protein
MIVILGTIRLQWVMVRQPMDPIQPQWVI